MKRLIFLFFVALGTVVAGCSSNHAGSWASDEYPASNPVGAPGATVQESLSGTNQLEE